MKTRKLLMISAVLTVAAAMAAPSPDSITTHIATDAAERDSVSLSSHLQGNAPSDFSAAGTPSFAVIGKGGRFMLSVGGYIKATVGFDTGHPISSPDEFTVSQIPMCNMEGNGAKFNISAQQSHLYLNFVALPGDKNEIGAFISANFLNNYAPVLQFAYLKYRGFQAGYDYNLFSDPAAGAQTIDYEGPNAFTAVPSAGFRYGIDFGKDKRWHFAVGAEMPFESFTGIDGRAVSVSQRVPDFPVALRYSWGEGDSWVRLSGVVRNLYYRNVVAGKNVDKLGYGVQLSGGVKIAPQLTFLYQGVFGKGIASYIQDLTGNGLDLVPSADGNSLNTLKTWGAYGGLQYEISPKWSCSATYSQVRVYAPEYAGGNTSWGNQYRYGQYAVANVFYNINSYFQTGLECLWGRRVNNDGMKCADTRIQTMFQLTF